MTFRDSIIQPYRSSFLPSAGGALADIDSPAMPKPADRRHTARPSAGLWTSPHAAAVKRVEGAIVVAMIAFFGMGLLTVLGMI